MRSTLVLMFLVAGGFLMGQGFHASFFQFTPLDVNPALTGSYYGNLRVSGLGRDQARSIDPGNGWTDIALSGDYNFDFGLTEGDWVSAGMGLESSFLAGEGNLREQSFATSLSYHFMFGKKKNQKVLTLGYTFGSYLLQPRNTMNEFVDPVTLRGDVSRDRENFNRRWFATQNGQPAKKTANRNNVGVMLDTPLGKKSDVRIGFSVHDIMRPRLRFEGGGEGVDTTGTGMGGPNEPPILGRQQGRIERGFNGFIFFYTPMYS